MSRLSADRAEVATVLLFLLVSIVAVLVVPHDKWHAIFGLLGSVLLMFPPGRQLLVNRQFHEGMNDQVALPVLQPIKTAISVLAKDKYVSFSWRDICYFFGGATILCTSFILDVFGL
jgi:hypothetical protein